MTVEAAGEVTSGDTITTQPAVWDLWNGEHTVYVDAVEFFVRALAGVKLLKLGTSMRWSDTVGPPLSSLRQDVRGLCGLLDKTKTNGADKKVEQLRVYVPFGVFSVRDAPYTFLDPAEALHRRDGLHEGTTTALGGACWRGPGRDDANFTECGKDLPETTDFHAVCKQCFPSRVQMRPARGETSSSRSFKTSV